MKNWLKAFRLRTLPLAFSCIITGSFLHYHEKFSWLIFCLTLSTTLMLQILSNLANDYGDFVKGTDNEDRVGPVRSIQSGSITKKAMFRAIIVCSILSLANGIILLGTSFNWQFSSSVFVLFVLGLSGIFAAIKYTVGKFALAYHALGDIFVFLFFGIIGVMGSSYLQTGIFLTTDIHLAITIGMLSTAVLNMNNMRDHINDANQNKITLVVKLGFENAKIYHTLLITIALINVIIFFTNQRALFFLSLIAFIPLVSNLFKVWRSKEPKKLDPELKKIALSTFVFSLLNAIISSN